MSISVRYIYSACVVIETEDVKILCDPWFTQGAYDGSWFHFPLLKNPIDKIGNVDIIYISHIHPDHYDPKFLKEYFNVYGEKEIVISDFKSNFLQKKMLSDGFLPRIILEKNGKKIDNTTLNIIPHETGSISDVDSALSVQYESDEGSSLVLNINDIITDEYFLEKIKNYFPQIDILLCSYTGAGPYPQTYFDLDDKEIIKESLKKKNQFFERYLTTTSALKAKVNIPFAGKYVLGGQLTKLNKFRGVADPVEILEIDPKAVVLDDGGDSVINTKDLTPSSSRSQKYSKEDIQARLDNIKDAKMDYEKLINEKYLNELPLFRLLPKAYKIALNHSELVEDYYFFIRLDDRGVLLNANKNNESYKVVRDDNNLPFPRTEIFIDRVYLFGLLTMIYHWNNAEIGSQFNSRRFPDEFNRKAQNFLNFFHI